VTPAVSVPRKCRAINAQILAISKDITYFPSKNIFYFFRKILVFKKKRISFMPKFSPTKFSYPAKKKFFGGMKIVLGFNLKLVRGLRNIFLQGGVRCPEGQVFPFFEKCYRYTDVRRRKALHYTRVCYYRLLLFKLK